MRVVRPDYDEGPESGEVGAAFQEGDVWLYVGLGRHCLAFRPGRKRKPETDLNERPGVEHQTPSRLRWMACWRRAG